jgi:hypothetical protein
MLFLGKIKIKGNFKGSHKKTDRGFKNSRAINHTIVQLLFFKSTLGEAKTVQEFPMVQNREPRLGFDWH